MATARRICLDCRIVYEGQGSRCPRCERERSASRPWYRGTYPTISKQIRSTPTPCWFCGEGDKAGDPWQAHHVTPTELARAHRSCNIKDGSKHPVFHRPSAS